jgi:hypothetical protein
MAIFFLDFPRHNLGNGKTWLFTAQQGGFFRTDNGGATWKQVYDNPMTHGGNQIYCSKTGALYSGGYQYPARSTDNGLTWAQVKTGLDYSWYMGVSGDGDNIYVAGVGENRPFFVSPESDGINWTPYQGGAQKFSSQPFEMHYDSANGIMYSANWNGMYALKVPGKTGAIRPKGPTARKAAEAGPSVRFGMGMEPGLGNEVRIDDGSGKRYTVPGRLLKDD